MSQASRTGREVARLARLQYEPEKQVFEAVRVTLRNFSEDLDLAVRDRRMRAREGEPIGIEALARTVLGDYEQALALEELRP